MRGVTIASVLQAVTLPFRLIAFVFDRIGKASSLILGFLLMVSGAALIAGPMVMLGVPLFLIGLHLSLRAMG